MSRNEEWLPAPVLKTQQSSHDMMPIIVRLPFYDVTSNTDDFLVTATITVTHLCIYMYVYVRVSFLLRLDEKQK